MNLALTPHTFEFQFPAPNEPAWSPQVERWYQLDAAAYGLVQSYSELNKQLGESPDMMILASPKASNVTDQAFALSGASSPSKFVHTLANVRAAPLLQVMQWGGPVLCVQHDPQTILCGINQAVGFMETDRKLHRVWVLSITDFGAGAGAGLRANYFNLSRDTGPIQISAANSVEALNSDSLWLEWVCTPGTGSFNVSRYYQATK
jgi:hypothetical protein